MKMKPCPHCGNSDLTGPIFAEYSGNGDHRDPCWWVECSKCPARMEVFDEKLDSLASAWNLRNVDKNPDPRLLRSMAIRYRHDFGLLDSKTQAALLTQMRQLWEEVVGLGFYHPEK